MLLRMTFSFSFRLLSSFLHATKKLKSLKCCYGLNKNSILVCWFCWTFNPIHNKTHATFLPSCQTLRFSLHLDTLRVWPAPAEAIVSGCIVVGYDGIGGSEIFDLCKPYDVVTSVPLETFIYLLKASVMP